MAPPEPSSASSAFRALAGLDPDRSVVWLRDDYDISDVAALAELMAEVIALDDKVVIVDLSAVRFMGVAPVRVLIEARTFLEPRSRSLVLRSPSTCVRRLLEVCGLAGLVEPCSEDATLGHGSGSALGTWVAVPPIPQADPHLHPSASEPAAASDPVPAVGATATSKVPSPDTHAPGGRVISGAAGGRS